MGTRRPKQRLIFRNCMCGNLNQVYIARKVHNRFEYCEICRDWAIKSTNLMNLQDSKYFLCLESEIQDFALAWG